MQDLDLSPFWLTLKLAAITTTILLIIGLPLAAWIGKGRTPARALVETLIAMPLVLPPSVLGFYLLLAFSPQYTFGRWLIDTFNLKLVFSFPGLVIGSVLFSLPFMVQPVQAAFANLPRSLTEASYTLGKSRLTTFWRVELPNVKPAIIVGTIMAFAHTVGEFGVVLMIGGNIPGVSRVMSIAIYHEVEQLNYDTAHLYSAILFGFSFAVVLVVNLVKRRGHLIQTL
ncbi:molybdate ABC transporter permease subunit [Crenobacter cavernae]|uniref:Molybdenum transport system permease n=1 Tax=Crenobacter cavernae TaxID=2290923 RepID=A0ABY0FF06_9NEIS|nr:molybdate ABC transporter permease subunit [Crenobacter cavernae]RXZ44884.1 molybdate ABC transporter permease subunit [Crenobacter cavernae]